MQDTRSYSQNIFTVEIHVPDGQQMSMFVSCHITSAGGHNEARRISASEHSNQHALDSPASTVPSLVMAASGTVMALPRPLMAVPSQHPHSASPSQFRVTQLRVTISYALLETFIYVCYYP